MGKKPALVCCVSIDHNPDCPKMAENDPSSLWQATPDRPVFALEKGDVTSFYIFG
jgi:CO dehydrogenase/acetyl-CoA synthase beta subunit